MNENKEKLEEYSVCIIEERRKYVNIKAESEEEAIKIVHNMYWSREISLTEGDVINTEIR